MPVSFDQLLARLDDLPAREVETSGRLAATLDAAYLVDPDLPFERWRERRVLLDVPGLTDRLLAEVPARGGAELAYWDPAVVRGRIVRGGPDGVDATIGAVTRLVVEQRGRRYELIGP